MDPILSQTLMQDFEHVQPLPGINMDPILDQALTQDSVFVQPIARTKRGSNFESDPYAGLCAY